MLAGGTPKDNGACTKDTDNKMLSSLGAQDNRLSIMS